MKISRYVSIWILFFCGIILFNTRSAIGQTYQETFGQNRMQYRKFEWKYFDTKHFRVYHYDKAGRQLGRYVAEEAENNIVDIEKKLGGQFPHRFNIVLYNSYEEYRQSNIGLKDETAIGENTRAGTLNLVGDKLVVYFTGKHSDLKHQIKSGMALVVMERQIFGENFKKIVKNALLLNLPQWVTDGYIAYLVDGWDAKSNCEWKNLLDASPKRGFYEFAEQYPELAGKAFWKFVANQYGIANVKNLLYAFQSKSSLNQGMKSPENLGMKVTKAYDSCIKFYKGIYKLDARNQESPDSTKGLLSLKVPNDNSVIKNILVSPRGSDVSYVVWKNGEYTVYTQKTTNEQERSTLLEGGQKDLTEQTDPNYPMLTYSSTGNKMAILYKKGAQLRLRIYNSLKGRIDNYAIPKNRFDRVLGITFMQDDDKLVFSAIKKSQTDLYIFTIKGSKIANITDDVWDDVSPVFVSGGSRTGILFLSNRPEPNLNVPLGVNELPTGAMNMFFYNTKTMRKELLQCTNMKTGTIQQPIQYGLDNFAYLCDNNGITNKYVVLFARDKNNNDSAYSVPITNYNTDILSHQYNLASDDVADVIQVKNKYKVYFHELQMPGKNVAIKNLKPTILSIEKPAQKRNTNQITKNNNSNKNSTIQTDDEEIKEPVIKGGNAFVSEFTDTTHAIKTKNKRTVSKNNNSLNNNADSSLLEIINDSAYLKMKPALYRLSIKPDFFSIKLDNTVLFSQYQSYAKNGGQYVNPSIGTLTSFSMDELLENQRFIAGFQLPINLTTSSYFLQYQNFARMVDWGIAFMHTQSKDNQKVSFLDPNGNVVYQDVYLFKSTLDMVQADFNIPLDRVHSIRFHTSLREDKMVAKARDSISLMQLDALFPTQYWSFSRFEYVYDNTICPAMNIRLGTRYKFYSEYMYELNNGNQNCYNFGLDARTYRKIYKNIIWASRVAYGHSDGNSVVQYILGGVDNWIYPQKASSGGLMSNNNYGFMTLATSLRGYNQGARKGNNFAVLSTEIRLPVVTTFFKRPIQSSLLRNLQLVPFMDAGSAWDGFFPSAENTIGKYSYPSGSSPGSPPYNNVFLKLTVPNANGLALGYGCGLRTSLFNYFIRADLAKNIDNPKQIVGYLALGLDF